MTDPSLHSEPPTLVLLPGVGADRRVFDKQTARFERTLVPDWIEPGEREPLQSYARRLAETIHVEGPCYVAGLSFGGMIAPIVARRLGARGCFLIASIRGPEQLPPYYRLPARLLDRHPKFCRGLLEISRYWAMGIRYGFWFFLSDDWRTLLSQYIRVPARWTWWTLWALMNWQRQPDDEADPPVPIFHIHGRLDPALPLCYAAPDVVLPRGTHILTVFQADAVNAFLAERMKPAEIRE